MPHPHDLFIAVSVLAAVV